MKEYKILSLDEELLNDKYAMPKLESTLNKLAKEGWIVKTVFTHEAKVILNLLAKNYVFVLEREVEEQLEYEENCENDQATDIDQNEQIKEVEDNDYDSSQFWKCNVCGELNSNDEEICSTCGVVKN